jgi:hypothetical protein
VFAPLHCPDEKTALVAYQEVEDQRIALRILSGEAQFEADAVAGAKGAAETATNRYKAGPVGSLDVPEAQTTLLANERVAVQIGGQRLVAMRALCGGSESIEQRSGQAVTDIGPPRAPHGVTSFSPAAKAVSSIARTPSKTSAAASLLLSLRQRVEGSRAHGTSRQLVTIGLAPSPWRKPRNSGNRHGAGFLVLNRRAYDVRCRKRENKSRIAADRGCGSQR